MMTHRLLAIAGVLVLAAPAPVAAAGDDQKLFPDEQRKEPYAKLFSGSSAAPQERAALRAEQPDPDPFPRDGRFVRPGKVVCGMLMIPVDAGVDPHMRKSPPEGDRTRYTIRAVKPPMCTSR